MPRRPLRASFNGSRARREPEKGFKNHAISRPSEFGGGRTNDDDDDDDGVSSHKGKARNSLSNGARTDRKWWIEKKRKGVKGTLLTISFPSLNRFRRDPSFSYDWIFLSRPSLLTIINKEGCFVDVGKACPIRVIRSLSTFILLSIRSCSHGQPPPIEWMKNFSLPSTPPQIPRNDISSRTKRGRKTRLAQVLSGETPRPFQTPGLEGWRVSGGSIALFFTITSELMKE